MRLRSEIRINFFKSKIVRQIISKNLFFQIFEKIVDDWKNMLEGASHFGKDRKKDRFQERFEKLVKGVRERHDKMVEKGCTFEKINQSAAEGAQ